MSHGRQEIVDAKCRLYHLWLRQNRGEQELYLKRDQGVLMALVADPDVQERISDALEAEKAKKR